MVQLNILLIIKYNFFFSFIQYNRSSKGEVKLGSTF